MQIRIDDIKPLGGAHAGQLWMLVSYLDSGSLVSREQCHFHPVFASIQPKLDAGQLIRLDGERVSPEDATAVDHQIGFEQETVLLDVASQARRAAEAFLPALAKSQQILSEFAKLSSAQLVAIAAGRKKYCQQLLDGARAAKEPGAIAKYEHDLASAEAAESDPELLAKAAADELAIYVKTVSPAPETPAAEGFAVDASDSRGLLSSPEIAALKGSSWEV